jgi:hypothetical protein
MAVSLAETISQKFDEPSEDIQDQLLFKLSENEDAASDIVATIADNYDKLSTHTKDKLLCKLIN